MTRCCTSHAASRLLLAAARAGDIDELDRCLEITGSLADKLDQPPLHWVHIYPGAPCERMIAGDTDQAEQLATEAHQIGTDTGEPDANSVFGGQVIIVSLQRGTLGDLAPLIERTAADESRDTRLHRNAGMVACRSVTAPMMHVCS